MLAKKALALVAQKFIYKFLIIWVGVLAPLVYVENFSSHRGVQTVQISLLKKSGLVRLSTAVRQILAQRSDQWPGGELKTRPQFVVGHLALPEITSALKVFHDNLWLNSMFLVGFIGIVPWKKVLSLQLTGYSAYLPPPEKPPPFPQGCFSPGNYLSHNFQLPQKKGRLLI
jgi:hypothetical protein